MGATPHRCRARGVASSVSVWARDVAVPSAEPLQDPCGTFVCRKCQREGPLRELGPDSVRRGWCRACVRAYFADRGDVHKTQVREAREARRVKARDLVFGLLAASRCADCGLADPMVLEFDHVGEKGGNLGDMVTHGYSVRALQREIEACEVVCANCHRYRTSSRRLPAADNEPYMSVDAPYRRRNVGFLRSVLAEAACADCGLADPAVLEFDHIGPKRSSVVQMGLGGYSIAALRAEIAECQVRCRNCHRRRTHEVMCTARHRFFNGEPVALGRRRRSGRR